MRLSDQEHNRLLVLKKLRASEPVARTDLVALTGLTGGTITAITADLIKRGLVIEEKVASSSPGRPRVNLRINPKGKYVVGSTATTDGQLVIEIVNLSGESLALTATRLVGVTKIADLASQFIVALNGTIEKGAVSREEIYRIGIGLPAIVDNREGIVESIMTLEPGPFPFARTIEEATGIPTLVDNNINLLARAEHWFGVGAHSDDFTLIHVDLALGAALYRGGQLITGANGIASEFGHVKVVPDTGKPCFCGGIGCLNAYSSVSAILQRSCEILGEPIPGVENMAGSFEALVRRHAAGEVEIWSILEQASHYLAIAVANHITMQDPEEVVIMGPPLAGMDRLRAGFVAALEQNTFPAFRRRTRIHYKPWDKGAFARGAAAMVLEKVYSSAPSASGKRDPGA